jgi:hypothetical protein
VSGSPWLRCVWRRLTRQGVGRTPHGRKGDARGRKRGAREKKAPRAGGKGRSRAGERKGIRASTPLRGNAHLESAPFEGGRKREERRKEKKAAAHLKSGSCSGAGGCPARLRSIRATPPRPIHAAHLKSGGGRRLRPRVRDFRIRDFRPIHDRDSRPICDRGYVVPSRPLLTLFLL